MPQPAIPSRPDLVTYDQLAPELRETARRTTAEVQAKWVRAAHLAARRTSKLDLHAAVNDPHHIRRLVSGANLLARIRRDVVEAEKSILGNLCMFGPDGRYHAFIKPPEDDA